MIPGGTVCWGACNMIVRESLHSSGIVLSQGGYKPYKRDMLPVKAGPLWCWLKKQDCANKWRIVSQATCILDFLPAYMPHGMPLTGVFGL